MQKFKDTGLTQDRIAALLSYDPETGKFTWLVASGKGRSRTPAGTIAGTPTRGYVQIKIDQSLYYAHRLAWVYTFGTWPDGELDHINRDRTDNRICNLRPASRRQNSHNTKAHLNSASGIKGVDWNAKDQKWRARIRTEKGRIYLGSFDTKDAAAKAYGDASDRLHGVFAPLGAS